MGQMIVKYRSGNLGVCGITKRCSAINELKAVEETATDGSISDGEVFVPRERERMDDCNE